MKSKLLLNFLIIFWYSNSSIAQPGSIDLSFLIGIGANNIIETTIQQNDGKIIIGGWFNSFNGSIRNKIARLNSNGSLDNTFDPGTGPNSIVKTIAIQNDGKIIIGGNFNTYNGIGSNYLARLNTDGTLDTNFNIGNGANDYIRSIKIQNDGKIIIGGYFTSFNGVVRNHIARLNTDGTIDPMFDPGLGPNNMVYTTAIQTDGKIIIGGDFTSFNGASINMVARLNVDGSLDMYFAPGTGANLSITSISLQSDGKIILSGGFTSFNGTLRNRIARLNINGTLDTYFNPGIGANHYVNTTSIQSDGKIILGGEFTSFNGSSIQYFVRLNDDATIDTTFESGTGPLSSIKTIAIQNDGKIIIGGGFSQYNGSDVSCIARINGKDVNSNVEILDKNEFIFSPNPFCYRTEMSLRIPLNNASIHLFDESGNEVRTITNLHDNPIIITSYDLPPGLYYWQLVKDNKIISSNKLIISE